MEHSKKKRLLFLSAVLVTMMIVHVRMLVCLPDPIFMLDSSTYFMPAIDWVFKGHFSVPSYRTPGYPAFLAVLFSLHQHFSVVLFVQHAIALVTAMGLGVLYYVIFDQSYLRAVLTAFLCSVSSGQLLLSHNLMPDTLYTGTLLLGLLLFFVALRNGSKKLWMLSAIVMAVALTVRPVALSTIAALLIGGAFLSRSVSSRKGLMVFFLTLLCFTLGWSTLNYVRRGYFGMTKFGGITLFGSVAYLLDADRIEDPHARGVLKPLYDQKPDKFREQNWVRYAPDGPVKSILKSGIAEDHIDRLLKRLSMQAIYQNPFRFVADQIGLFFVFIRDSGGPKYIVSKEFSVMGGLWIYQKLAEEHSYIQSFIQYKDQNAEEYFKKLQENALYPYELTDRFFWWLGPILVFEYGLVALGFCLGGLLLYFRVMAQEISILMLVMVSHVIMSNLGGDEVGRYAVPIEPLCYLIIVFGAHQLRLYWKGRQKKCQGSESN